MLVVITLSLSFMGKLSAQGCSQFLLAAANTVPDVLTGAIPQLLSEVVQVLSCAEMRGLTWGSTNSQALLIEDWSCPKDVRVHGGGVVRVIGFR